VPSPSARRVIANCRRPLRHGRIYRELAEPGIARSEVIGCCDSRVSPEVIFDARPGELFVVRNVANIVPPYEPDGHAHGVSARSSSVAALKVKRMSRQHAMRRRQGFCRKAELLARRFVGNRCG
jgi:carbonic anhydrase